MSGDGWRWRLGFLHGYGEAMWQELGDNIRRITKFMPMPNGQSIIMRAVPSTAARDPEPQFSKDALVIDSVDPVDGLVTDVMKVWEPSGIVPVNGKRRIEIP